MDSTKVIARTTDMSENDDLAIIKRRILGFVNERDWTQFHTPKDVAISLSLEAAEVLEHFQWKDDDEVTKHLRENKQAVAEELMDVLYWVVLMCHYFDIDIPESFEKKMQKNEAKYPATDSRSRHDKYTVYTAAKRKNKT